MPAPQKNNRRDRNNNKPQHRINEQIRCREVRIVGDDIESEVMATRQAIQLAQQKGVDLVEISPNAVPPVCRLINYSKFLYQQIHLTYYIKCLCYLVKFLEPVLL